MRRRLLLLALLLLVPSFASAHEFGYGRTFIGGTITAPILAPTDCATAVFYGFSAAGATAGFCRDVSGNIIMQSGPGPSAGKLAVEAAGASAFFFNASNQASGMQALDGVTNFYVGGAIHAALTAGFFTVGIAASTDRLRFAPGAAGAGAFTGSFGSADLTADRAWSNPDMGGTTQLLLTGTAAPGATDCDAANEAGRLYHQTGDPATVNLQLFRCTQTGPASYAWHPVAYQLGTSAPATCAVGAVFFDSDATAGSNWFGCTSANTWTALGGGVADCGVNGIAVRTAANTLTCRTPTVGEGVTGSNLDGVAGAPNHAADRAVTMFKGAGTADPPATCGDTGDSFQISDNYIETDTKEMYTCDAIDHWTLFGHVADDKVIVGDGTNAVLETIPDCDDSGGNHLNYNTTGSAGSRFSCGTSGGGTVDYSTTVAIYDEMAGGNNTSSTLGSLGWTANPIGSPSANVGMDAGDATHPWTMRDLSATDNTGHGLYLHSNNSPVALWTGRNWTIEAVVVPGTTAGYAITSHALWFGLSNASNPLTDSSGIWIRRDTDLSDTAFVFAICDSATTGCQDAGDATNQNSVLSTVTPVTQTGYLLKIRHALSGVGGNPTYYFSVNGETEKTFCSSGCDDTISNQPASGYLFPVLGFVTRAEATTATDWDYFALTITSLARN